jgi:hypothetical protein
MESQGVTSSQESQGPSQLGRTMGQLQSQGTRAVSSNVSGLAKTQMSSPDSGGHSGSSVDTLGAISSSVGGSSSAGSTKAGTTTVTEREETVAGQSTDASGSNESAKVSATQPTTITETVVNTEKEIIRQKVEPTDNLGAGNPENNQGAKNV